jgi:hypothetical protein
MRLLKAFVNSDESDKRRYNELGEAERENRVKKSVLVGVVFGFLVSEIVSLWRPHSDFSKIIFAIAYLRLLLNE